MKKIYIVGNPNSGKTTLFNKITKSFEHTGNYSGVTVDLKSKEICFNCENYCVIDLPGAFSLTPFSIEEKITADCILDEIDREDCYILNLIESNTIKRSLNLTLELLEANFKVLTIINEIGKSEKQIDAKNLGELLGINVYCVNVRKQKCLDFIFSLSNYRQSKSLLYVEKFKQCAKDLNSIVAIKICENDENALKQFNLNENDCKEIKQKLNSNNLEMSAIFNDRLSVINKVCISQSRSKIKINNILDKIFLNKFLAIPIFLMIMLSIFYITFSSVGAFFTNLLDDLICVHFYNLVSNVLDRIGTNAIFNDFILTAMIEGVGSLICFLPQIVLLFLFISLLEDSGYLPRLAFLLDDLLAKFGLSGKSLFTFIMSFGCSTTAMLTAKNLDNEKSKIKTMLLSQYMTCSAKLPILTVLCGAFFTGNVFMIFAFYLIGVLISMIASIILQNSKLKTQDNTFILEMPSYNFPPFSKMLKVAIKQSVEFLVRVGGVVLLFMAIIWLLENFNYKLQYVDNSNKSLLYTLGSFIAPIFAPLGFDNWGIASALIVGLVAKEIIVSTISMLNHTVDNVGGLMTSLMAGSSVVSFTDASALSFMVFVLLYAPCISSMSLIKKEIGGKYLAIAIVMQFIFAYFTAMFTYTFATLFSSEILTIIFTVLIIFAIILFCLTKNGECGCWHCLHKKCECCSNCNKGCNKLKEFT